MCQRVDPAGSRGSDDGKGRRPATPGRPCAPVPLRREAREASAGDAGHNPKAIGSAGSSDLNSVRFLAVSPPSRQALLVKAQGPGLQGPSGHRWAGLQVWGHRGTKRYHRPQQHREQEEEPAPVWSFTPSMESMRSEPTHPRPGTASPRLQRTNPEFKGRRFLRGTGMHSQWSI